MPAVCTRTALADLPSAVANHGAAPRALLLALALALFQTFTVAALSGRSTVSDAYLSLYQWDSVWYAHIAEHGYPERVPDRQEDMATVGFFPGYPIVTRLVMSLTGLPSSIAVLIAAQLACWGFWTYLLLFFYRWQTPRPVVFACIVTILAHPAAFYLIAGYSESLFLFAALGFLWWKGVDTRLGWWLAALHGVLLTATRIVGLPLAVVPIVLAVVDHFQGSQPRSRVLSAALLGAVALLGGAAFFVYCQFHVGQWDVYFHAQSAGWGVKPDYLAIFNPETYRLAAPDFIDGTLNPNWLSRMCVPFTAVFLLVLVLVEMRNPAGWRQRLPLYLSAGLMFYLAVSGLASLRFLSLVRYTFCVHVVLALAVTQVLSLPVTHPVRRPWWLVPWLGTAALPALLQMQFVRLYTAGQWVS